MVTGQFGGVVQYIIFEQADGDVRQFMNAVSTTDLKWRLNCLHHIATGLKQLHGLRIAHQDVKPSNVLQFQHQSKLADLGRASVFGKNPAHDEYLIAGDPTYAPPEFLYGFAASDWNIRRLGCDAYLLGSMIVWFYTMLGATPQLIGNLLPQHQPIAGGWSGAYDGVLPFLQQSFGSLLLDFEQQVPTQFAGELTEMVRQLCNPDPRLRGRPGSRFGSENQYQLNRYITQLDLIAKRLI